MDWLRLSVFAHIFFSILLVGLALFWVIMQTALGRRFAAAEAQRLLQVTQSARWPHVGVPYAWRLPLPWLTWAVILGAWVSGILNATLGGEFRWSEWWPKWALVAMLALLQLLMTPRPRPALFRPYLAFLLVTVAASAWLTRTI